MLKALKILACVVAISSLSGCAAFKKTDDNPNKLEKSPCACGEIYNSETDHA